MNEPVADLYPTKQIGLIKSELVKRNETSEPFVKQNDEISIVTIPGAPSSNEQKNYTIISREHGRSIVDTRINSKVFWTGTLEGDLYGAKDWKGARMEDVVLEDSKAGYMGLRVKGLKDSFVIDRINKVSKLLRENGLPTENPIKFVKILEIIDKNNNLIPIEQWKAKILKEEISNIEELEKTLTSKKDQKQLIEAKERLKRVEEYFKSVDFFIEERELQTAERLVDLTYPKDENSMKSMLSPIFKWLNLATNYKESGLIRNTDKPENFEFSDIDLDRYLRQWLPSQMGIYLARLHKLGLAHKFPHRQNWSVVGTLYDLDSVSGPLVGDGKITKEDIKLDTTVATGALIDLFTPRNNYLKKFPDLYNDSQASFITSYLKERFGNNISETQLEKIQKDYFPYADTFIIGDIDINNNVWDKVYQNFSHQAPIRNPTRRLYNKLFEKNKK